MQAEAKKYTEDAGGVIYGAIYQAYIDGVTSDTARKHWENSEGLKNLIQRYESEVESILKRRPDLEFNGDFSSEGERLNSINRFLSDLKTITNL